MRFLTWYPKEQDLHLRETLFLVPTTSALLLKQNHRHKKLILEIKKMKSMDQYLSLHINSVPRCEWRFWR